MYAELASLLLHLRQTRIDLMFADYCGHHERVRELRALCIEIQHEIDDLLIDIQIAEEGITQ